MLLFYQFFCLFPSFARSSYSCHSFPLDPHPHPKVGYWITKVDNMDNNHIHFYKLPTNTKSSKTRNAILVNFTFNYIEPKQGSYIQVSQVLKSFPPFLNSQFIFPPISKNNSIPCFFSKLRLISNIFLKPQKITTPMLEKQTREGKKNHKLTFLFPLQLLPFILLTLWLFNLLLPSPP